MKSNIEYGDQLTSVTHEFSNSASPTGFDETTYFAGKYGCRSITVGRVEGPYSYVLTAQITFEDSRPGLIIPLYKAARFEV